MVAIKNRNIGDRAASRKIAINHRLRWFGIVLMAALSGSNLSKHAIDSRMCGMGVPVQPGGAFGSGIGVRIS